MKKLAMTSVVMVVAIFAPRPNAQLARPSTADSARSLAASLEPTNRSFVSREAADLWLAPTPAASGKTRATEQVASGIKLYERGEYGRALQVLSDPATKSGTLADYALYYAGLAQLRLARADEARKTFQIVGGHPIAGYLAEASALGEAEADEALGDPRAAMFIYERLLKTGLAPADDMLMRIGRTAQLTGDAGKAGGSYARVYYEFPLSDQSSSAGSEMSRLSYSPAATPAERFTMDMQRAEQLFSARQYGVAKSAFESLRLAATGDDRDLIALRLAECDYFQKRSRQARDALRLQLVAGPRLPEALYFFAAASSDAGDKANYLSAIRRLIDEFPTASWTEQALDQVATTYILQDDDDSADATFRQVYERFPLGPHADRAAWKIGWRAYRQGNYAETASVFERAAAGFPHSDYRPAWLYWAGRAHEQLTESVLAQERYRLTTADYLNSYYGRLALSRLGEMTPTARVVPAANVRFAQTDAALPPLPQNADIVRRLLDYELYDDAMNELRFASRVWGDQAAVRATIAWIHQKQGQLETGSKRFTLVRGAITAMRRAYPQFMSEGGEELPHDILAVIFPLTYWDLINRYSAQHNLDPYLVAALVAQESTFVPDIKSYANAVGLMQLMPFTGRQYAKKLGIRYSLSTLTNPENNIKLGTAYFADKIAEFGDVYLALASYNAGEGAVHKWMADRPGIPRDEFIDDIPYPQTQNYVKRILGTADDYRRLYSGPQRAQELLPARKLSTMAQGVGAPAAPGSAASKPSAKKTAASKTQARKASKKKTPSKKTHK